MVTVSNQQPGIIRTERGLTITGTRITLYDVMDYVTAQYPLSSSVVYLIYLKNKSTPP